MHGKRRLTTILAVVAAVVVGVPTAAWANATSEWEWGYQWPTYGGNVFSDSTASNGQAVEIWEGDVDNTITNSASVGYYAVRARGLNCSGSPQMKMTVDGSTVLPYKTINVGTTWTDFRFYGPWSSGTHDVAIYLTNPSPGGGSCYRALKVDKVTAVDGTGFVTRTGSNFYLDGDVFKYVGYNAFGMQGCDSPTSTAWTTPQIQTYFADLSPNSVVRVWAMDGYGGTTDINRILTYAKMYQQKVILVLGDGRNNCESDGAAGGTYNDKTDAWYKGGYSTSSYKTWVGTVVNAEKNDPTVFAWEILNELGANDPSSTLTDSDIRSFLDSMAGYIKGIDSNHLVSSGSQATYLKGTSDFAYIHGGSNIDFGSVHEYDYDYEPNGRGNGFNNVNIAPEVSTDAATMQTISKPLIVGETGIAAGASPCRTSLSSRASLFSTKISTYLGYTGVAGVNVWNYIKPGTQGGSQTYQCDSWNGHYETGTGDTGLLSVVNSANNALHP